MAKPPSRIRPDEVRGLDALGEPSRAGNRKRGQDRQYQGDRDHANATTNDCSVGLPPPAMIVATICPPNAPPMVRVIVFTPIAMPV